MKKKTFIKGTVLPVMVLCSAMTFSPVGMQAAKADTQAVQQAELLKGTIVDKNGETIIGASVVIVGGNATQGAITDLDGNFSIKARPGAKLKISYVGYKPAVVTAKQGMRIVLEEDNTMLQEVEVVAYGTQKKVTVTGALSSVKNEDLTRTPVSSVNNVLAGQLSGVTTVQYSGEPGSDAASIFVRGKGTFTN